MFELARDFVSDSAGGAVDSLQDEALDSLEETGLDKSKAAIKKRANAVNKQAQKNGEKIIEAINAALPHDDPLASNEEWKVERARETRHGELKLALRQMVHAEAKKTKNIDAYCEMMPAQTSFDIKDLQKKSLAIPLVFLYQIIYSIIIVYLTYTTTISFSDKNYLSAVKDPGAICVEVPVNTNAKFFGDIDGNWNSQASYSANTSLYTLVFTGTQINNNDYATVMKSFEKNFTAIGEKVSTRDMAYALVAFSSFTTTNSTYAMQFYTSADTAIIFQTPIAAFGIASAQGSCRLSGGNSGNAPPTVLFNRATHSIDVFIPVTAVPPSNLNYTSPPIAPPTLAPTELPPDETWSPTISTQPEPTSAPTAQPQTVYVYIPFAGLTSALVSTYGSAILTAVETSVKSAIGLTSCTACTVMGSFFATGARRRLGPNELGEEGEENVVPFASRELASYYTYFPPTLTLPSYFVDVMIVANTSMFNKGMSNRGCLSATGNQLLHIHTCVDAKDTDISTAATAAAGGNTITAGLAYIFAANVSASSPTPGPGSEYYYQPTTTSYYYGTASQRQLREVIENDDQQDFSPLLQHVHRLDARQVELVAEISEQRKRELVFSRPVPTAKPTATAQYSQRFDVQNGFTYNEPCPDQFAAISDFGYDPQKDSGIKFSIDMASVTTAIAINLGMISLDVLTITDNKAKPIIDGDWYIDTFYAPMIPILCLKGKQSTCLVSISGKLMYPSLSTPSQMQGVHVSQPAPCNCHLSGYNGSYLDAAACNKFDIYLGLVYYTNDMSDKKIKKFARSMAKYMIDDPSNGDLNITQAIYPSLLWTIDAAYAQPFPVDNATARTPTYNTFTSFFQKKLAKYFSDICSSKDGCGMIGIEFADAKAAFSPLNINNVQLSTLSDDPASVICRDTIYHPRAFSRFHKPPVNLVASYFQCHLSTSNAFQQAIGVAAGSASLYGGIALSVLVFLYIAVINFMEGQKDLADQEVIMPIAVKAKVTDAEHRLFRNATIGMMKKILDKFESPELQVDALRQDPIFLFGELEAKSIGDKPLCSLDCLTIKKTELWEVPKGDLELASLGPYADKIPVSSPPAPAPSTGYFSFLSSSSTPAHGKDLDEKNKKKENEQSEKNDKQLEMLENVGSMLPGNEGDDGEDV